MMDLESLIASGAVSLVVSGLVSGVIAPRVTAHYNRKNAKDSQRNSALIGVINELINMMAEINAYIFRFEGDAMDKMWVKRYRDPMVDEEFVKNHKEELQEFTILDSNIGLFWKENEDYFQHVDDQITIKSVEEYLKLVSNLHRDLRRAFSDINENQKEKVLYPEILPDIFLHDSSIKLGKLRWKLINER